MKKCPFCGWRVEAVKEMKQIYYVRCKNEYYCGAETTWYTDKETTIKMWNKLKIQAIRI